MSESRIPLNIPGRHEGIWPPGPCRSQAGQFPDAICQASIHPDSYPVYPAREF